jgi:hypothetical protein
MRYISYLSFISHIGIAEDPVGRTILVASEEDAENLVVEEQAKAKVTHNIVFVTGEASPYAKSGGLGDVCGSLPVALAARGHRVMVIMPRYLNRTNDKNYANAFYTAKHIKVPCFGGEHEVTFFHEYRDSVDWVGICSSYCFLMIINNLCWYCKFFDTCFRMLLRYFCVIPTFQHFE